MFPKEFDVQIHLDYGEMIVFHNAIVYDEHSDDDTMSYTFCATTKTVEYLPYWEWFWENIFDDIMLNKDNHNNCMLKIGDIEIPIRSFSFTRNPLTCWIAKDGAGSPHPSGWG